MSKEEITKRGKYYTIVQGTFRTNVPQDHLEAVRRDWKSADGKSSGTKYERVINAMFGKIEDISFQDGDYGMQVLIKLDPNENGDNPIIALATASREGEDFLKKLPNIDLDKEVRLRPFNFEGSQGDEVRGMEIMQQNEADEFKVKITNFFRDPIEKKNINGMPDPESSDLSKDEWKMYFLQVRLFIIKYAKQHIIPRFGNLEYPADEAVSVDEYDADKAFDAMTAEAPAEPAEATPKETLEKFKPKAVKKKVKTPNEKECEHGIPEGEVCPDCIPF